MKHSKTVGVMLLASAIFFILLDASYTFSTAYAAGITIVGNKDVPVDTLSKKELKNIYLGKRTQWDGGQKIIFLILKSGATHKTFLKRFVGKSKFQYSNYWKKMIFTGKGKKPKSFQAENALVDFVAKTPGAVGYISSVSKTDGVKIISVK